MNNNKGFFITVEGVDGSGKTTFSHNLTVRLQNLGVEVMQTREPGGCSVCESIRNIIKENNNLNPDTDLMLMFASRTEHVLKRILPALEDNKLVISDRFVDSSYAYQVKAGNASEKLFNVLEQNISNLITPDLTILIDTPLDVAKQRLMDRGLVLDKFEQEDEFRQKTLDGYEQRIKKEPSRFLIVDGDVSLTEQKDDIETVISYLFEVGAI